jgi:hypothetical protein
MARRRVAAPLTLVPYPFMLRFSIPWLIAGVLLLLELAFGRIALLQLVGAAVLLMCLWGSLEPHISFGERFGGIRLTGWAKAWVLAPAAAIAMSLVAYAPDIVCAKKRYRHECAAPDQSTLKKTP